MQSNSKLYRELCTPFASAAEANKNVQAFCAAVATLREQYRIRDLYMTIGLSFETEDGEEAETMVPFGCGDAMQHETLLAYALGMVQAERQECIGALMSKAIKKQQRRP